MNAPGTGASKVRRHRRKRREAGLVEIRAWVLDADRRAAVAALAPFRERCLQRLREGEMATALCPEGTRVRGEEKR